MDVKSLDPEASVEGFDVSIVLRLAGSGEVKRRAFGLGPQIEVPADDLGAVVDPNRLRIANDGAGRLEGLDDITPRWLKRGSGTADNREKVSTPVSARIFSVRCQLGRRHPLEPCTSASQSSAPGPTVQPFDRPPR